MSVNILVRPKENANVDHAAGRLYSVLRRRSFRAFVLCGLAGVSVDIDHLISYLTQAELSARFLHLPLLIMAGAVFCGVGAYLGGLCLRMVLKRRPENVAASMVELPGRLVPARRN